MERESERHGEQGTPNLPLAVPVLKADGRGVGYCGHAIVSSRSSAVLGGVAGGSLTA